MKTIIFGVSGQDGAYLSEACKKRHVDVVGVSRVGGEEPIGDVADSSYIDALIREQAPDYVFHLTANSTTRHDVLFQNHQTISTRTLNIPRSSSGTSHRRAESSSPAAVSNS
jgi:GDPmannose 4,6-dehydratase